MGGWLVLGFDAVTDALKDSRLSSDLRNSPSTSGINRMLSSTTRFNPVSVRPEAAKLP